MTLEQGLSALYKETSEGFRKYRGTFWKIDGKRTLYSGTIIFGGATWAYCQKNLAHDVQSYSYVIYFPDATIATYEGLEQKLSNYLSDFKEYPDEDEIVWKRSRSDAVIILSKDAILGDRYKVFIEVRTHDGDW
jgi:hypothetical protein